MSEEPQLARPWKNKRRKSLYTEEADAGFIFKKIPRFEVGEGDALGSVTQTPPPNEGSPAAATSLDISMETEGMTNEDIEIAKEVELKRFLSELKKELLSSGAVDQASLDAALEGLAKDLKSSDVYFKFLQTDHPKDLPPHPLSQQLQENISGLKTSIEMCKREIREWDELAEQKQEEVAQAMKDLDAERDVDFLNLESESAEALKTYLTEEEAALLREEEGEGGEGTVVMVEEAREQLTAINKTLDLELQRIQTHCRAVSAKVNSEQIEVPVLEDTPRSLFRALKEQM